MQKVQSMTNKDESMYGPNSSAIADRMDRRGFFRGAALLGGLGAAGLLPLCEPQHALASEPRQDAGAAEALSAQTQRILRWAGPAPADWVRPRADVDYNVVVVGGGQTGLGVAYGLRRKGIGRILVIDQADPGQAGVWRTIARMKQLRTPKTIAGPEHGNTALGFRAWYETLHGPRAFDGLDRIPRLVWSDYLAWYEQITAAQVRYRTRLLDIEPIGDVLRLHLETEGTPRTQTTRKLVLASGYSGAGGASVPGFLRALPASLWAHTEKPIRFERLSGKVVGILGAGASAFDAAGVALERGAAEVHLFSRRSYIEYTNAPAPQSAPPVVDRGYPNMGEMSYALPEEVRWRNQLGRERAVASVPLDSLNRAVSRDKFNLYLNSPWDEVAVASDGRVAVTSRGVTYRFDYVIAGTGYQVDLSAQPELARIHDSITLWRDRYRPGPGEADRASGAYPYLGAGFQFLPRDGTEAAFLRNIHCANLAATVSFNVLVGDVPSMVLQPQLISAIARDFYVEGVDVSVNKRYVDMPLAPPDPTPYRRAIRS
ncbi:MAG TPA: FAD/NAD(P)-binding protein [Steroidobacteraceae bacterium]|nr:FAD/NAD(P)-binding protein [Steroidobacteraceae bacterium]